MYEDGPPDRPIPISAARETPRHSPQWSVVERWTALLRLTIHGPAVASYRKTIWVGL
jgi:hypothetical protein